MSAADRRGPFDLRVWYAGENHCSAAVFRILVRLCMSWPRYLSISSKYADSLLRGRHLPRHPRQRLPDELIVDALAAVVEERVGDEVVDRVVAGVSRRTTACPS